MISLRPSLITEHHSVSSLNDPAREASPCSRYLRPARDVDTTCTVGRNVHESMATKVRAHRAPNLLRGCVGRSHVDHTCRRTEAHKFSGNPTHDEISPRTTHGPFNGAETCGRQWWAGCGASVVPPLVLVSRPLYLNGRGGSSRRDPGLVCLALKWVIPWTLPSRAWPTRARHRRGKPAIRPRTSRCTRTADPSGGDSR